MLQFLSKFLWCFLFERSLREQRGGILLLIIPCFVKKVDGIFLSSPSLLLNQTKQGDLSFELNALLINLHASLLFHGYLVSGYLLYTYWQVYSGLQSLHMNLCIWMNNHIIWALRICIICFLDFVLFVYMIFLGKMKILIDLHEERQ